MRVVVVTDFRFNRDADGLITSTITNRGYTFWTRYLDAFDQVVVVGRVSSGSAQPGISVEGPGVSVAALPDYRGALGLVRHGREIRRLLDRVAIPPAAFVVRMPSAFGGVLLRCLRRDDRPYGLEVVGDPYEVFGPRAMRHPLRPILRFHFARELRAACRSAAGVAYVTTHTLQRRYPPGPLSYTTHYSSLTLPPDAFLASPRRWESSPTPLKLVCVGRFAQAYKGQDVLLDAVAALVRRGRDVQLTFVGDGARRSAAAAQVSRLGLEGRISFAGEIGDSAVIRSILDQHDLFVLPSLTEGLPRVLIEAMARGLPAVATNVGGVRELLPPGDVVPPGDPISLSDKIDEMASDGGRLIAASARNLARAHAFAESVLARRRNAFYSAIADATRRHLTSQGSK